MGLNAAVPRKYKRSGGDRIGAKTYKANDDPRAILNALRNTYGRPSPGEKRANEKAFGAGWNPADLIEELYDRLEECFVVAIVAKPAYTREQMIDKALIAIQSTGLFEIAVLEWNGFDAMNQTWPEFKEHFAEAYDSRLASGAGTASQNGYHNAYNAVDDDSIGSIKESLAGLQMANNANCQQLNDNLSAITQESRDL